MAHQTLENTYSLPAAADLSAAQFQAVVVNGSAQIALAGLGVLPLSVLDNNPKAAAMARWITRHRFIGKIRVGVGGIAAGAPFCSDATGKAVVGASTHKYFGTALQTGVAGQLITAIIDTSGALGAKP